ncbi:MAG: UDP-N-acetylmuramate dehydrogenase [Oscillospiraceae bacterium]
MPNFAAAIEYFTKRKIPFSIDEPLKNHTSFHIGGSAAVFCIPQTVQQLKEAALFSQNAGIPCFILGNGTNVLFEDGGYAGVVVSTEKALSRLGYQNGLLEAGAGVAMQQLCEYALDEALTGLEFAYGIPGSVGGAVFMNAGAYGGEIQDVVASVRYLNEQGDEVVLQKEQLELGYRQSVFQGKPWVIISASFCLQPGSKQAIRALMQKNMASRTEKQPLELPSAGSAFKRPQGAFAGALIDQCGLRGFRVGDAAISQKHCGFIVNLGNATCRQVLQLANEVSERVLAETGFLLEKEIRVVKAEPESDSSGH